MLKKIIQLNFSLFCLVMISMTALMKFLLIYILDCLVLKRSLTSSLGKSDTKLIHPRTITLHRQTNHALSKRWIPKVSDSHHPSRTLAPADAQLSNPGLVIPPLSHSSLTSDFTPQSKDPKAINQVLDGDNALCLSPSNVEDSPPTQVITLQEDDPSSSNPNSRFGSPIWDEGSTSNSIVPTSESEIETDSSDQAQSNVRRIAEMLPRLHNSKPRTCSIKPDEVVTKGNVEALRKKFESLIAVQSQNTRNWRQRQKNTPGQILFRNKDKNRSTDSTIIPQGLSHLSDNQVEKHTHPLASEESDSDEQSADTFIRKNEKDSSGLKLTDYDLDLEKKQVEAKPVPESSAQPSTKEKIDISKPVDLSDPERDILLPTQNPSVEEENQNMTKDMSDDLGPKSVEEKDFGSYTTPKVVYAFPFNKDLMNDVDHDLVASSGQLPNLLQQDSALSHQTTSTNNRVDQEERKNTFFPLITATMDEANLKPGQAKAITQQEDSLPVRNHKNTDQKKNIIQNPHVNGNEADSGVHADDNSNFGSHLLPLDKKQLHKKTLTPIDPGMESSLASKLQDVPSSPKDTPHVSNQISQPSLVPPPILSQVKDENKIVPQRTESSKISGPPTMSGSPGFNVFEPKSQEKKQNPGKSIFFLEVFNEEDHKAALALNSPKELRKMHTFDNLPITTPNESKASISSVKLSTSSVELPNSFVERPTLSIPHQGSSEALLTTSRPPSPVVLKGILKKTKSPVGKRRASQNKNGKDVKFEDQEPNTPKTFSNESGKDEENVKEIRIVPPKASEDLLKNAAVQRFGRERLMRSKSAFFPNANGRNTLAKSRLTKATFSFRNIKVPNDWSDDEESVMERLSDAAARPRPMIARMNRKDMDLIISKAIINERKFRKDPKISSPTKMVPYYVKKADLINRKINGDSNQTPKLKKKPKSSSINNNNNNKPALDGIKKNHLDLHNVDAFLRRITKINYFKFVTLLLQQPTLKLHLLFPGSIPLPLPLIPL